VKRIGALLVAVLAARSPLVLTVEAHAATRTSGGYWMLAGDGHVYPFGGAANMQPGYASTSSVHLTPTHTGNGYWVLSSWGSIENAGDAKSFGTPPPLFSTEKYTTMAASPDDGGYWVFTNMGRVLRFGDAQFFSDMSGVALNGPVLDAVSLGSGGRKGEGSGSG
jgi:hypothetical protein